MLTQARARSIVLASSGFFTTHASKTNRKGVYAFDVNADLDTAHLVIDSRALSCDEKAFIGKRFKPSSFEEFYDAHTDKVIGFRSPYNFKPPRLSRGHSWTSSIRTRKIPFFQLNSALQWAVPAAFLDIRPKKLSRERAIDLYLRKAGPSNHERLLLEAALCEKVT